MKVFWLILFLAGNAIAQTLPEYLSFTRKFEGTRLIAYKDTTGNLTIGTGHKLSKSETFRIVSPRKAENLFQQDMTKAIISTKRNIKNFDTLPRNVKLIFVDLAFNCGDAGLRKFKKAISAANTHDFIQVAEELENSKWYKQTGRRARNHVSTLRNAYEN